MNFKINNDQDGFNSYISQDEFFNQGGGLGTTSLAGGYGSIPKPFFGRPRPTIKPSIPSDMDRTYLATAFNEPTFIYSIGM